MVGRGLSHLVEEDDSDGDPIETFSDDILEQNVYNTAEPKSKRKNSRRSKGSSERESRKSKSEESNSNKDPSSSCGHEDTNNTSSNIDIPGSGSESGFDANFVIHDGEEERLPLQDPKIDSDPNSSRPVDADAVEGGGEQFENEIDLEKALDEEEKNDPEEKNDREKDHLKETVQTTETRPRRSCRMKPLEKRTVFLMCLIATVTILIVAMLGVFLGVYVARENETTGSTAKSASSVESAAATVPTTSPTHPTLAPTAVKDIFNGATTATVSSATISPTSQAPTTQAPAAPTTQAPTTQAPTTQAPTTQAPANPTTQAPTTQAPANPTTAPTTELPTTSAPITSAPSTAAPVVATTAAAPVMSQFRIELMNVGNVTMWDETIAEAAAKWEQIIVGDVPNQIFDFFGGDLFGNTFTGVTVNKGVDDIIIGYDFVDGLLANQLGSGQYTKIRSLPPALPYAGTIEFNQNLASQAPDNNEGLREQLFWTTVHEIGHVLGFGTMWIAGPRICGDQCPGQGNEYTCLSAIAQFNELFPAASSSSSVVLTLASDCGHWDPTLFDGLDWYDVMSPTYLFGRKTLVSKITIGAMQDLGYTVNYNAADPL